MHSLGPRPGSMACGISVYRADGSTTDGEHAGHAPAARAARPGPRRPARPPAAPAAAQAPATAPPPTPVRRLRIANSFKINTVPCVHVTTCMLRGAYATTAVHLHSERASGWRTQARLSSGVSERQARGREHAPAVTAAFTRSAADCAASAPGDVLSPAAKRPRPVGGEAGDTGTSLNLPLALALCSGAGSIGGLSGAAPFAPPCSTDSTAFDTVSGSASAGAGTVTTARPLLGVVSAAPPSSCADSEAAGVASACACVSAADPACVPASSLTDQPRKLVW